MSNQSEDPIVIAKRAEQDLNSHKAKVGHATSDSATESGIDTSATTKFPSATATYGSAATGREIPLSEGGDIKRSTGQPTKDRDFEGPGGPEDKARIHAEENPGADDVQGNVRQGGDTTTR